MPRHLPTALEDIRAQRAFGKRLEKLKVPSWEEIYAGAEEWEERQLKRRSEMSMREDAELALCTSQRRLAEQQERLLDETKQKLRSAKVITKALEIRKWFLSLEFSEQDLFAQEFMRDNPNKDLRTFFALREEAAREEDARETKNAEEARKCNQSPEQAVERTKRDHDGAVQFARKLWRMIHRGVPISEALERNTKEMSTQCQREMRLQPHIEAVREKYVPLLAATKNGLRLGPGNGDEDTRVATAGALYAGGKSVREVGKALGVTYHTARKMVLQSGAAMRPVVGGRGKSEVQP